jgi:hypothetical protein
MTNKVPLIEDMTAKISIADIQAWYDSPLRHEQPEYIQRLVLFLLKNIPSKEIPDENKELRTENAELTRLFELHWASDMRAIERWRKEQPEERELIWPDKTDLTVYLMGELQAADNKIEELRNELNKSTAVSEKDSPETTRASMESSGVGDAQAVPER